MEEEGEDKVKKKKKSQKIKSWKIKKKKTSSAERNILTRTKEKKKKNPRNGKEKLKHCHGTQHQMPICKIKVNPCIKVSIIWTKTNIKIK